MTRLLRPSRKCIYKPLSKVITGCKYKNNTLGVKGFLAFMPSFRLRERGPMGTKKAERFARANARGGFGGNAPVDLGAPYGHSKREPFPVPFLVPRTRLELARPFTSTSPSSWRVYQFHHLGGGLGLQMYNNFSILKLFFDFFPCLSRSAHLAGGG